MVGHVHKPITDHNLWLCRQFRPLFFNCSLFLLFNRNTWKSLRVYMLHWPHWNLGLNTVCKLTSSVRSVTTAAITHLHSVCTQQVQVRSSLPSINISSWMWLSYVTNLVCYYYSACCGSFSTFFMFFVAVTWKLHVSFLSLLGRPLVWLRILPVLCGILLFLFLGFLYKWHKFRRKPTEYTTPESILVRISSLWSS